MRTTKLEPMPHPSIIVVSSDALEPLGVAGS